ncbi:MAG TPA: hypothetical protein VD902_01000, partial [Symbiobacteriaceae bacterium]|nr:hypothetical protein [Symbiobacteriaceae bacterium]
VALGAPPPVPFMAALTATALGGPAVALIFSMAGRARAGAMLLLLSFVGGAGVGLYGLLGIGMLSVVYDSPPGTAWKWVFFMTAALLPLLQIKGILDAVGVLAPGATRRTQLNLACIKNR